MNNSEVTMIAESQGTIIELRDDERQPCEVWTRVMGYHRPVASFNTGKQGEHRERKHFMESRAELEDGRQ
jgi:anaerobic ribonucleoside-triphosphate reductase